MFIRESDLVDSFLEGKTNYISKVLNRKQGRFFCVTEFDSQFGVADIVLGTFQKYKRVKASSDEGKHSWCIPLFFIRKGEVFTAQDFSERFGYSLGYSKKMLNYYMRTGFVVRKEYLYRLVKEYEYILEDVIAIEAKLKNWKRALEQAKRYKKFANLSYVLLDEVNIGPALKNIREFKNSNIGLLSLSAGQLKTYCLPGEASIKLSPQLLELNEYAKKSLTC